MLIIRRCRIPIRVHVLAYKIVPQTRKGRGKSSSPTKRSRTGRRLSSSETGGSYGLLLFNGRISLTCLPPRPRSSVGAADTSVRATEAGVPISRYWHGGRRLSPLDRLMAHPAIALHRLRETGDNRGGAFEFAPYQNESGSCL